jgi:hypothetical protein
MVGIGVGVGVCDGVGEGTRVGIITAVSSESTRPELTRFVTQTLAIISPNIIGVLIVTNSGLYITFPPLRLRGGIKGGVTYKILLL